MVSIQKILVGTDVPPDSVELTPASQRAVKSALRVARQTHADVTLMSVLKSPPVASDALIEGDVATAPLERAVRAIHAAIVRDAAVEGVSVVSRIVHGNPADELIREVLREGIDLLVAGARHRSQAMKMLFGSTSQTLLRQCPCPLWIPREGSFEGDVTTVVAADELEAVGEKVLRFAVAAAQFSHSRLLVVHAVQYPLEAGLIRTESSRLDIYNYKQKVRDEAEAELARRLSRTDYRTVQAGTLLAVEPGAPEVVIGHAVRDNKADLLVIGTHGRSGLAGLLVGNSVERILAEVPCSVLAIKPDDFVCPVRVEA